MSQILILNDHKVYYLLTFKMQQRFSLFKSKTYFQEKIFYTMSDEFFGDVSALFHSLQKQADDSYPFIMAMTERHGGKVIYTSAVEAHFGSYPPSPLSKSRG